MKTLLFFILMLTIKLSYSQVLTTGVFVAINKTGNPMYDIVSKGSKPNINPVVVGKTYTLNRSSYGIVTTNDTVEFLFSNGLITKIGTNSTVIINDFQQEILNISNEPVKAKFGSHILSISLMEGESLFVFAGCDSNSSCIVSTPLVDIELIKGEFFFRCSEKGVAIFVINGSLRYHGEHGKSGIVDVGKAVFAAPIQFQNRMVDDKIFLNTKKIKDTELKQLTTKTLLLNNLNERIMFCVIDGHLIGVNID